MILKINCGEEAVKHHWFIVDNITRIRYHNEMAVNDAELVEYKDIDRIITNKKNTPKARNFIVVYCHTSIPHKEFDEEYNLMFDTIGYLCNDLGQTLERLVP